MISLDIFFLSAIIDFEIQNQNRNMIKEFQIFNNFLKEKNLKLTNQRKEILSIFLKTERHVSVEDLYDIIKEKDPDIGQATVFRTLKLLSDAGIAKEVDLGDKRIRYEHSYGHKHHDHLICIKCKNSIEAVDPKIECLQDELCRKYEFTLQSHKMEIFGVCRKCKNDDGRKTKDERRIRPSSFVHHPS